MPWPGEAKVAVAVVHVAVGFPAAAGNATCILDGRSVECISSQLRAEAERPNPAALRSNAGRCYRGNMINGAGFVHTPEESVAFVKANPNNERVIRPYLGGEEINNSPRHEFHRYVIDFGARPLPEMAREWPELLDRVERLVKPARDAVKDDTGKGGHGKKYWWQFLDRCEPLIQAVFPLNRCLVAANVTKHLVFAWQPKERALSNTLSVFAFDAETSFSVLQSRVHEL